MCLAVGPWQNQSKFLVTMKPMEKGVTKTSPSTRHDKKNKKTLPPQIILGIFFSFQNLKIT